VTTPRALPERPSLQSIRKQAKKLLHEVAAHDPGAIARARAQLPEAALPLTQRDAQLVLAREYGFAGWQDLKAEVLKRTGHGLVWAAGQAGRAIHDDDVVRLERLLDEHPALVSFRDPTGATLLSQAALAFSTARDAQREQSFTRRACAELLLERGAVMEAAVWENVVTMRSKGMLEMLSSKNVLPRTLRTCAALGDFAGVRAHVAAADRAERNEACADACAFEHGEIAAFLLERCIELDPELGRRIDAGPGRSAFMAYLGEHVDHHGARGDVWKTFVLHEVTSAIDAGDEGAFLSWLEREPELCAQSSVELVEYATFMGHERFLRLLLDATPALLQTRPAPASSALEYAFEYGHAGFVPLLARIWEVPDDLPHAAGSGDFARVRRWFSADGELTLDDPTRHYPLDNPRKLGHLRWRAGEVQHVLDSALAWACLNHHFAIATFLLEHGADIDTDWSTHEPASILHECANQKNYAAAKFLIERGIDLTTRDYRWKATAQGWARHAAHDDVMVELLADAERSGPKRAAP
jgi:ankyrin repeat protein